MVGRSATTSSPAGAQGRPTILSSLKSLLETGKPLLVKMGPPQRMLAALKGHGDQSALTYSPREGEQPSRRPGESRNPCAVTFAKDAVLVG